VCQEIFFNSQVCRQQKILKDTALTEGITEETCKELVKVLKNINFQENSVKIKSLEIPIFSGDEIRD